MNRTPSPPSKSPSPGVRRVFALISVLLSLGLMLVLGEVALSSPGSPVHLHPGRGRSRPPPRSPAKLLLRGRISHGRVRRTHRPLRRGRSLHRPRRFRCPRRPPGLRGRHGGLLRGVGQRALCGIPGGFDAAGGRRPGRGPKLRRVQLQPGPVPPSVGAEGAFLETRPRDPDALRERCLGRQRVQEGGGPGRGGEDHRGSPVPGWERPSGCSGTPTCFSSSESSSGSWSG